MLKTHAGKLKSSFQLVPSEVDGWFEDSNISYVCLLVRSHAGDHSSRVPDGGPGHVPRVHQRVGSYAQRFQQQGEDVFFKETVTQLRLFPPLFVFEIRLIRSNL